jgi:DNA-binding transcriptional ArsR family regulator
VRPLVHPAIEDVTVEAVLHALADPVRVAIYARIVGADCAQSCSALATVAGAAIPKSTLSQHFNVLRAAAWLAPSEEREGVV